MTIFAPKRILLLTLSFLVPLGAQCGHESFQRNCTESAISLGEQQGWLRAARQSVLWWERCFVPVEWKTQQMAKFSSHRGEVAEELVTDDRSTDDESTVSWSDQFDETGDNSVNSFSQFQM